MNIRLYICRGVFSCNRVVSVINSGYVLFPYGVSGMNILFFPQNRPYAWVLLFTSILTWTLWLDFTWALAVLLFVYIHELGHAIFTCICGGRVGGILIFPMGGVTLSHPPHKSSSLAIIALGGSLANLVMGLVIMGVYYGFTFHWEPLLVYARAIAFINLINLFPFPVTDGGHFLSSLLVGVKGYWYRFALVIGTIASTVGLIWFIYPLSTFEWIIIIVLIALSIRQVVRIPQWMCTISEMSWLYRIAYGLGYLYVVGLYAGIVAFS